MTYKTRKRIWPVAVVSLAVFGLLAAAVALYVVPTQPAQAHGCDEADALAQAQCITDHEGAGLDHNSEHEHDPNQPPVLTGTRLSDVSLRIPSQSDPIDASVAFSDPDEDDVLTYAAVSNDTGVATVSIDADSGMMVISTGTVRGQATITVTATDESDASVSITLSVRVSEGYTLTAVPMRDPANPTIYVVEDLGEYTAKFSVMVGGSNDDVTVTITARVPETGGITVTDSNGLLGAGFNQEDDLEGSLTIKKEDDDDSRAFEIEGACGTEGAIVTITVEDDDLDEVAKGYILCKEQPASVTPGPDDTRSDLFTVASYGDWEFDVVTDGFILDVTNGNEHMVNGHHNETGLLSRDEPVIHTAYTLGVSNMETLRDMPNGSPRRVKTDDDLTRQQKNADVEEGQRTIEVLVGQPNVQLTVTSKEASPAYIRFLDKDMQPFGTDLDEELAERGADVVGLDSQGRLALNNRVALSAAKALAYDQYSIKTPDIVEGQSIGNSYLVGAASAMDANGDYIKDYNQGAFRFFNPCPVELGVDHEFYVQVYESTGKYLETTEKIDCVPSPRPGPTGLEFTIDSEVARQGVLTFEPALNSVGHTVLLIDAHNRNIVESVTALDSMFNADTGLYTVTFDNLNNGWTYHIVVLAEGVASQYTAHAVRDYGVSWLGQNDVPLSTAAPNTGAGHNLCEVEDAEITALLSNCDTNTAPMAVGSIAAQTVAVGESQTVDVSGSFRDADMGDMLTYMAMSSNTAVAGVEVSGAMVTISGVSVGSATITVTATDMHGEMASQAIMVTVEAAALTAPTNVQGSNVGAVVTITWEGGENAATFTVALIRQDNGVWDIPNAVYDAGVSGSPHTVNMATRPAGSYHVFVVAGDGADEWTDWVSGSVNYQP